MFGILNIYKPAGWTSRDVVNRVQKCARPAKAGHAGTLDPLATGVLVVCVGPATRLISYVQQQDKEYDATFLLGRTSPSDDVETDVCELENPPVPTYSEIVAKLPKFLGVVQQRPPIYSALKVDGKRAYKLAREGADIELPTRPVKIHELKVEHYTYPELRLKIRCGSGTYVRSLGRDLAESLGSAAVMSSLNRTAIGNFRVGELHAELISEERIADHLIDPVEAVSHLPRLVLSGSQQIEIGHGRMISALEFDDSLDPANEIYAAIDPAGELIALLKEKRPSLLGAICNFPQSS